MIYTKHMMIFTNCIRKHSINVEEIKSPERENNSQDSENKKYSEKLQVLFYLKTLRLNMEIKRIQKNIETQKKFNNCILELKTKMFDYYQEEDIAAEEIKQHQMQIKILEQKKQLYIQIGESLIGGLNNIKLQLKECQLTTHYEKKELRTVRKFEELKNNKNLK